MAEIFELFKLFGNWAGLAACAIFLWVLLKERNQQSRDDLKAFREEIQKERDLFEKVIKEDRADRTLISAEARRDHADRHEGIVDRLDKIEEAIRNFKAGR